MNATDVRRFLAIAEAGGFSTFGRLSGPDELDLAVAAYGVALEHVNGTPEQLLRLLIAEGVDHLPSAGKLAEIIRTARLNKMRRESPPPAITSGSVVPPRRGWLIARDAYVRQCERDDREPTAARLAQFDRLATRNANVADGFTMSTSA